MNILLINHYAGSKTHGMEYRPYYLAKEWVKNGHKVRIIAASYSHVISIQPVVNNIITKECIDGIEYVWVKTNSYGDNGIKRFVNMLSFVTKLLIFKRSILKSFVPDVVIASSTYPLDIFPARYYAKQFEAKLVFEVHDLWPLSPMELGGMYKLNPFIMLMQYAENFAYKHSDYVVSMLPNAVEHMIAHGMNFKKFNYIPNGINVAEWEQIISIDENIKKIIVDIKNKGHLLIGYAGAHGVANALDSVIDAMAIIKDKSVSLVLIGQGPEKSRLQERVKKLDLSNVIFIPTIKKECIPSLLNFFDILFIGLQKQPLFRFGISPNKLMDYMMAGKPVIQAIDSGNNIVGEAQCGLSVEAENPEKIANAIIKISQLSKQDLELIGKRGREFVLSNNTYEVLANKFLNVIK